MNLIRLLCLALLVVLTSCSMFNQSPPNQAIRMAITQQLTQTQQSLAQDLGLSETAPLPNFKLEKVDVSSRQKITDAELLTHPNVTEAYKVRGTFSAKIADSSDRTTPQSTPFELYLGTDTADTSEIQTWFLIAP